MVRFGDLVALGAKAEALQKASEAWQKAQERRERVYRALADAEDLLHFLTEACEDPSLREIVARYFKVLEACMAALAYAALCIPPEPEEVGK
jgi:hypothetical protein